MVILLKGRIRKITGILKEAGKERLAECIDSNWHKTALQYSKELNFWRPKRPMEKELLEAFEKELHRLETPSVLKREIINSIKKRRVLQTAPHLGCTESPRMLCINWLGSLAVPEWPARLHSSAREFYVVGMFSGIPFSNRSRPGRINRKSDSVNLFPSSMQDGLVYRSSIPQKLIEAVDSLPGKISKFLPTPVVGEPYTKWAIQTCEHLERTVLKKKNLVYIDINEVIAEYLGNVLQDPSHIFYKIFFKPKIREKFARTFPEEIMFYVPVQNGKYEKTESMTLSGSSLKSKTREIDLRDRKAFIREIQEGRLCPGLIITFLTLSFLNHFKCLGSFAQVEYLPVYQKKLAKLAFMKEFNIEKIPTSNLTTGTFPEKSNTYPMDIISENRKLKIDQEILFGELLINMKDVLLESYFIGDARKNDKK